MFEFLNSVWNWLGSVSFQLVAIATGFYAIVQAVKLVSITRIRIEPVVYVEGIGEIGLDLKYLEKDLTRAFVEARSVANLHGYFSKPLLELKVTAKRFGASNLKVKEIALIDAWKRKIDSSADSGKAPFEIELGIAYPHLFSCDAIAKHKEIYCLDGEYPDLRVRIENRMGREIISTTKFSASDLKLLLETYDSVARSSSKQPAQ